MLETQNYTRNPFDVEAVRVTKTNIAQLASWCGGEIHTAGKAKFVLVPVHKPANDRQTKAFIGDWVLYDGRGYKVYMPKAFAASFRKKSDAVNLRVTAFDEPAEQLEVVQVVDPTRADALLKEVVSDSPTQPRPGVVTKRSVPTAKGGVQHNYLQPSEPVEKPSHPGDMPGVQEGGYTPPSPDQVD